MDSKRVLHGGYRRWKPLPYAPISATSHFCSSETSSPVQYYFARLERGALNATKRWPRQDWSSSRCCGASSSLRYALSITGFWSLFATTATDPNRRSVLLPEQPLFSLRDAAGMHLWATGS